MDNTSISCSDVMKPFLTAMLPKRRSRSSIAITFSSETLCVHFYVANINNFLFIVPNRTTEKTVNPGGESNTTGTTKAFTA
jgi:hypothetical protein